MPGRELEPSGRSGPVLTDVAVEMTDIFARAGLGESAMEIRRPAAVSALRPRRPAAGTTTLLAAAAAGLAGLGAGAFVLRAPTPAPARPVTQAPAGQVVPAQRPITLAEAASAPVSVEAAPPPTVIRPTAAAKPARGPADHAAGRSAPTVALAKARARRREPMPMAQPASCEHNATGAGCRRAVIQADRHLRAVYERAVRRGVSHAVLVDYRDRWADLRERNTEDPVRLIESYGALAYDLGRESRDQEERDERRQSSSGWKSVADAFRPLPLR
jgi:hypothetical protein